MIALKLTSTFHVMELPYNVKMSRTNHLKN